MPLIHEMNISLNEVILLSSSIPFVILLFNMKGEISIWFKLLLISRFLSDILCFYFKHTYGNVFPIFHFSIFFETIFSLYLIHNYTKVNKKIMIFFVVNFIIVSFFEMCFGIWENNYYSSLLASGILTLFTFVAILNFDFLNKSQLLIVISLFLFNLSTAVYVGFENKIRSDEYLFNSLQPFVLTLILLLNFSFSLSLWFKKNI